MEPQAIVMAAPVDPDQKYEEAAAIYGSALQRLARGYEADPDLRRDLLQDIHFALWRSFANFSGRCSIRTWVYRVAHNVAASHVSRDRRTRSRMLGLDELEALPSGENSETAMAGRTALDRLLQMIQQLKPVDRQVILAYLEGMDAASIGEITGISPSNVATKIHRIKNILARRFQQGEGYAK